MQIGGAEAVAAGQQVMATLTAHDVAAGVAEERVSPGTAQHRVVAVAPQQRVVAVIALQEIVTALAGQAIVAEREDAGVVGVGRHFLGSNVFWYLKDPAGTMFELFSDIDQITDDEAWERDHCRRDWGGSDGPAPVSVWGPKEPPEFFTPADIAEIGAAREALGLD